MHNKDNEREINPLDCRLFGLLTKYESFYYLIGVNVDDSTLPLFDSTENY